MSAADVGQLGRRRRPTLSDTRPTSAADIFFSSFPTLTPTSADVGVSVGKLDRQCRRPTLADTQADTQSVTLVKVIIPLSECFVDSTVMISQSGAFQCKISAQCLPCVMLCVLSYLGTQLSKDKRGSTGLDKQLCCCFHKTSSCKHFRHHLACCSQVSM